MSHSETRAHVNALYISCRAVEVQKPDFKSTPWQPTPHSARLPLEGHLSHCGLSLISPSPLLPTLSLSHNRPPQIPPSPPVPLHPPHGWQPGIYQGYLNHITECLAPRPARMLMFRCLYLGVQPLACSSFEVGFSLPPCLEALKDFV